MRELPPAAPRRLQHTRQITCQGYEREDGLWEVEGRISDVRTWSQPRVQGANARAGGESLHLMSLRLTLNESFEIVAAVAVTHQSPYGDCQAINPAYEQLVGLRIEAGFSQAVKTRLRGALGCTHLTDLIGPMATTALQTMRPLMQRRLLERGQSLPDGPAQMDSCFALRSGGEAALIRWGDGVNTARRP
jgi:hypothetical protein